MRVLIDDADVTILETRRKRLPLSILLLVRKTQISWRVGSAQATVPVAPVWPNVPGEAISLKSFHTSEFVRPQPNPQGALRNGFWFVVMVLTQAGLKRRLFA